jgi:hypothetical protein
MVPVSRLVDSMTSVYSLADEFCPLISNVVKLEVEEVEISHFSIIEGGKFKTLRLTRITVNSTYKVFSAIIDFHRFLDRGTTRANSSL